MKAKTKLTKLWSILLVLVMVVGMLPTMALAAESQMSQTADFTSGDGSAALALLNAAKKEGVADSVWDSNTNTLTLNGVDFTTTAATAVKLPDGAIIVLNGENTIKGGNSNSDHCCGIDAPGKLTIQGLGTLNVTGGATTGYYSSYGICASRDLIIESGTVTAIGGAATNDNNSYGIYSYYDIKISGGTVTGIGGTAEHSYGICAYDNVIIEGGIVSAKGGTATDGYSYGIYTIDLDIKISGGTVTAEGGAADYSYGTRSKHDTYISGGTITGTGGAADIKSYGIRTADYIYVSGGTATGLGGTAAEGSYGFYAYNHDVNISGGTVTAIGGAAANGSSLGIYADEDIIISDGTVIAKANTSALDYTPQALPSTYWWRTSNSGAYNKYPASAYIWDAAHTYLEIQKPGYTVTFDANGGSGEMAGVDVVSGEYTLPANGFTAPEGQQFKCWSVDGTEKAVGATITVTANTTVKAVWENITYTVSFDSNGGTGTMTAQTGVLGDYTLPENGFTAPAGKQFKAWSVGGTEKAVGATITVTTDTTVKAVWENIPAAPTEYEILDGANSKWTQDSDGNISVRASGEFSKFVGVKVDGTLVDAKNYTVKEGSTIVTLKADYLNTLTAGNHTLEIVWTDGSAGTTFTVNAKAVIDNDTKSPQTGDNSHMALWIALLFVSAAGILATAVLGKKKKRSAR